VAKPTAMSGRLAVALAAALEGGASTPYTGWDDANNILPQLQRGSRFLILHKDDPEVAPAALGVLASLDIVLGRGSAVAQLGAAFEG
jgi:hypothetical protein